MAALFKVTVVPGILVVCAVLVLTSGLRPSQVLRWAVTASAAAVAVCALVAGAVRGRLGAPGALGRAAAGGVGREPGQLSGRGDHGGVAVAAVLAARRVDGSRRLALAAGAALAATVVADLAGYQANYHWLATPILVAVVAAAGLVPDGTGAQAPGTARPVARLGLAAGAVALALILERPELLAAAVFGWRCGGPGRVWAWGGGLAWFGVLLWAPLPGVGYPAGGAAAAPAADNLPTETMQRLAEADGAGTVHIAHDCKGVWDPWLAATEATGGRVRPLAGLNRETVASAEFILAPGYLHGAHFRGASGSRPHWLEAWDAAGQPEIDGHGRGGGARGAVVDPVRRRPRGRGHGVGGSRHRGRGRQDRALPETRTPGTRRRCSGGWRWRRSPSRCGPAAPPQVPVLWPGHEAEGEAALVDQAARGVALHTEQDRLYVTAESAGWAWLRVSWDPWWSAADGAPLKGGPGHLVVWVEPGVTELRWDVPGPRRRHGRRGHRPVAAAAGGRWPRQPPPQGWDIDPDRPRPAAEAAQPVRRRGRPPPGGRGAPGAQPRDPPAATPRPMMEQSPGCR